MRPNQVRLNALNSLMDLLIFRVCKVYINLVYLGIKKIENFLVFK